MTTKSEHLEFETISDYLDGYLDPVAAAAVELHLSECGPCSREHAKLKDLLDSVNGMPRSVLPSEDIWPDVKRALNSRKEIVLPMSAHGAPSASVHRVQQANSWVRRGVLAAAAVFLVALSSGITALVLRSRADSQSVDARNRIPAPQQAQVLAVGFAQTESEYNRMIEELKLAVDTQRDRLNPETVRTIDRSLAVVDSAITEARAALLADPNNRMLVDLLSANYQRKLDLLRRTSELSSRI